jgi:uncharacterized membrane protein
MNATLFIARIFGISLIVITLTMLFKRDYFKNIMEDFSKNSAIIFTHGLFSLIIGLAIILTHNIWVMNWTVIITFFGWAGLVKGIWLIAFPDSISRFFEFYTKARVFPIIHAIGGLLFGIYLTYMGFFGV